MAITNHERVGKAMELLKTGLASFIEREFKNTFKNQAEQQARLIIGDDRMISGKPMTSWDAAALLKVMWDSWNDVFRKTLGPAERSLVSELRDCRNRWAHQSPFSSDDAYRALDSATRLLSAVSATEADEIEKMKMELLRVRFDEQARSEKRKTAGVAIESQVTGTLKPWREVVSPHKDVATGRYQQAEFAADLWQVHIGEGSDEYRKPVEFFRRTFLTESLKHLLKGAVQRLSGLGSDPVVQLQTNFGGGKTHSMLALYHLFSGSAHGDLLGIDAILKEAGVSKLLAVRRVVLVGNRVSPGNPVTKADGTVVRTLWGELVWQLGFAAGGIKEAKKAFQRIEADDQNATSPGDVLRELLNEYGPSLILIDEWVAYARQLHEQSDLPGGSFETHFTFAQALTESAKLAKQCLLVVSLPASDTTGSPHTLAEDVEVGGERGRAALDRLRNAIGRLDTSWRPASAEEGFEIVRRRLFEPIIDQTQFVARDTVARAFSDFYHKESDEFPSEVKNSDYESRLKAAYPVHPEIFDRLYGEWSTLVKFQRTRGVLRLMAAVIHSLWEKNDRNPVILPASIPIEDTRVQFELTRYLSDNWTPVIERDIDGPHALPNKLDGEITNLGKYAACRRVARTIYLGSAPTAGAPNKGIDDRRIKLGCVMPGESPAIFGDALRRLFASSTFLYQDGGRYWYDTQATVTKTAEDRANQYKRDPDSIARELEKRLRADLRKQGEFARIHPLPQSGQDVSDDMDARLVVLDSDHAYTKDPASPALTKAKAIFESRGNTPRLYRNTLVFLAVDQARLQDLEEAICQFLAWESIVTEQTTLNLKPSQVKQAESQKNSADGTVTARLPEAYQWLLVPGQSTPQSSVEWQAFRLSGQDPLAVRASKKLRNDDSIVPAFAGTSLRGHLDRIPLWRDNDVLIKELAEHFARYLYLPRLVDTGVLLDAIRDGVGLLTWPNDTFAYADTFDEATGRYRGLRAGQNISLSAGNLSGLLVKPEVARRQKEQESQPANNPSSTAGAGPSTPATTEDSVSVGSDSSASPTAFPKPVAKRYHGSVSLDPTRVGRDAGRIADEVISHLVGLVGSTVKVTLEIEATILNGAPDTVARIVTENSRTLKFNSHGFEKD
jgi:predicted AAA+ superfamily ATPase